MFLKKEELTAGFVTIFLFILLAFLNSNPYYVDFLAKNTVTGYQAYSETSALKQCPLSPCAAPPIGCSYSPKIENNCPTCGILVCDSTGGSIETTGTGFGSGETSETITPTTTSDTTFTSGTNFGTSPCPTITSETNPPTTETSSQLREFVKMV